ncbi:MAG TPA: hypothetical protein VGI70_05580, partial [Polyangiales bacterium]
MIVLGLLLMAAETAQAAPSLRVRAKVRIELQAEHAGDQLRVQGYLRDDLAAALPGRAIQIRLQPANDRGRAQTRNARSDATGRFATAFDSHAIALRVQVVFEGDDFYERAEASQTIEVDRDPVHLQFASPSDWRVSLDDKATSIALRASSEAGGGGLAIAVQDELGRSIVEGRTDQQGALALTVPNDRLGEVGLGELVAISSADATRGAARASQPILRTRATSLRLSARPDANARIVAIDLQLMAAGAPLSQRAVGLFLDGEHLVTLLTDRNGEA